MYDLCYLQHELEQARQAQQQQQTRQVPSYRVRTAASASDDTDTATLLKSGLFTPTEISYFLGISLATIQQEQARLEERYMAKRKFLATGNLGFDDEGGYFAILQK
jgi:hypothetical protein